MRIRSSVLIAAGLLALGLSPALGQTPLGDSRVIAPVPAPGFPEGIAVRGSRFYVSGPATFGITVPPVVWAYDIRTGALEAQFPIAFANPFAGMRGLSCIAFGPDGKLYAIEPFVGVIRLHLDPNNTQAIYAPFPPPPPTGALPNDLAFDEDGNLYVTDSFQGLIYKIPPGGGAPVVWFTHPNLAGAPFGVNGIRIDKTNTKVYVSVTINAVGEGVIYRLPLVASPAPGDLETFFVYPPGDPPLGFAGPDGIAFGKSGKLYVALAGSNQVSVLRPDGTEEVRYGGPAQNPPGAPVAWTNPANIAFHDQEGTLLVTNHASILPGAFVVFDVFVDDKGQPLP